MYHFMLLTPFLSFGPDPLKSPTHFNISIENSEFFFFTKFWCLIDSQQNSELIPSNYEL